MAEEKKNFYESKINFFTQVAHEIRTPLTLIKGPLEKIVKHDDLPQKIEKNVMIMQRNTERLLTLTNDLLNFRESEETMFSLRFKNINVNQLVREVLARFQPSIDQKNIQISVIEINKDIYTLADEEALTKIVSNLLSNALKYCESRIKLKLYTEQAEASLVLRIQNDGTTVPEEMKDKIFEPFFRYKNTKETGTGIGLALAKSLTELHGGTLVYQKAENSSNSFLLKIPIKRYYYGK